MAQVVDRNAAAPLQDVPPLPGHELVEPGLRDLAAGRETAAALLVASFTTRLRRLGVRVPDHSIADPELRLYLLLARSRRDAHAHYNGLVQRLVSFAQAAECIRRSTQNA